MIDALNTFLNLIGSLPTLLLPPGTGFWLKTFGVTHLIGGIVTGLIAGFSIKFALYFFSAFRMLAKVGL